MLTEERKGGREEEEEISYMVLGQIKRKGLSHALWEFQNLMCNAIFLKNFFPMELL